jgi:alkane 1-monooxygenase
MTTRTNPADALPFVLPLLLVPLVAMAAWHGGWWLWLPPFYSVVLSSFLDRVFGDNEGSADPLTPEADLFWHRAITLVWFPLQAATLAGVIWAVTLPDHLNWHERLFLVIETGLMTGAVGNKGWVSGCWPACFMRISSRSMSSCITAMSGRPVIR